MSRIAKKPTPGEIECKAGKDCRAEWAPLSALERSHDGRHEFCRGRIVVNPPGRPRTP